MRNTKQAVSQYYCLWTTKISWMETLLLGERYIHSTKDVVSRLRRLYECFILKISLIGDKDIVSRSLCAPARPNDCVPVVSELFRQFGLVPFKLSNSSLLSVGLLRGNKLQLPKAFPTKLIWMIIKKDLNKGKALAKVSLIQEAGERRKRC